MPKRKATSLDDTEDNSCTVVVKKGLRSICKNDLVYNKIQQDVTEMSALIVEASIYIHHSIMKRWRTGNFEPVKFLHYYYPLMIKKKMQYCLDPEYENLRNTCKTPLRLYDSAYRSNLFVDSSNQYEMVFHNNIWIHGYTRLRCFFNSEPDKSKVYRTLSYLFQAKSSHLPDEELLNKLRTDLQWTGEKLDKLQNKKLFWNSLYLFYNLQRYNERNNLRNFALIPIFKHGLHHIRYDTFAFRYLLSSLKLCSSDPKTFDRDIEWRKYFKFPETKIKKFNYSLQTDGVSVSFSMKKPAMCISISTAKRKQIQKNDTDCQGDLLKIRNTHYDDRIGLDPGLRLIYGGVKNDKPIKLKNSTYQAMNGHHSRKRQLAKYTQSCNEISQESPFLEDTSSYTKYRLEAFVKKQNVFGQRKVARLKLKKFICVEKTVHKVAAQLVPDTKRATLICIGSTEIGGNSPIRGYIRTPNKKIIAALRARLADILFVNEFRTTKLCANCHQPNITSKSTHRYQFCPNCHTCWNRDVNAGINILYLGECIIHQKEKHLNFCRI